MIHDIRTLLRSRYHEIEFFDANYLYSDDPLKLLTVIKLCVDNYTEIKQAHEQLKTSMADPRVIIDQHEILIENIIKHEADIEELIHDSQSIHIVKQFSRSFNDILDWLDKNLRRILPHSNLNIELVNKINLIKKKHNTSTEEIIDKLARKLQLREGFIRKLENVLNTSINPILTYILFDPFKKSLSVPADIYNMPRVRMGLFKDTFLTEMEMGINAFLLKLQKNGRFKFAEYLKNHFDLNMNLQSEYDDISEGVDRLFSITHGEKLKCDTLMEKLKIIENQVSDQNLADLVIKADTELEISIKDFNKYINYAIEKLSAARQKCALIPDLDSDTTVTIETVVNSFTSILLEFSLTPLDIRENITKKLDRKCLEFVKNIDNSITSFSKKFKQLKETMESLEKMYIENIVEIDDIRTAQSIMLNKIQEVEDEIQEQSLEQGYNTSMPETTNKVDEVCETVMKYSTDLMNQGIIMRRAHGLHKIQSSSDSDFDADISDSDYMSKMTDQSLDEIPDSVLDQQLDINGAESSENIGNHKQWARELFLAFNRLQQSSESHMKLNSSIIGSKTKYEGDCIIMRDRISHLIKSLTIYSYSADLQTVESENTANHPRP